MGLNTRVVAISKMVPAALSTGESIRNRRETPRKKNVAIFLQQTRPINMWSAKRRPNGLMLGDIALASSQQRGSKVRHRVHMLVRSGKDRQHTHGVLPRGQQIFNTLLGVL